MPASAKIIDRIKKLWALASSPNANEAASALERARALMAEHAVTESDIAEVVVDVADDRRDPYRDELARIVGVARGVVALGRSHRIGFRGMERAVRETITLYQCLARAADDGAVYSASSDSEACCDSAALQAWTGCYWMGFLSTLTERFIEQLLGRPYEAPKTPDGRQVVPVTQTAALEETVASLVTMASQAGDDQYLLERITHFRMRAVEAGRQRALTVILPVPETHRLQLARHG